MEVTNAFFNKSNMLEKKHAYEGNFVSIHRQMN
jgi:hypothetical protein